MALAVFFDADEYSRLFQSSPPLLFPGRPENYYELSAPIAFGRPDASNPWLYKRTLRVNGIQGFIDGVREAIRVARVPVKIRVMLKSRATDTIDELTGLGVWITARNVDSLNRLLMDKGKKLAEAAEEYDDFSQEDDDFKLRTQYQKITNFLAHEILLLFQAASDSNGEDPNEVGGCNRKNKDGRRANIPAKFEHFEGFNPAATGHNCGLQCLRQINKNLPSCMIMRKLLNVASNVMLTPAQLQQVAQRYKMPPIFVATDDTQSSELDKAFSDGNICLYLRHQHYVLLSQNHHPQQSCTLCGRLYRFKHECNIKRAEYFEKQIMTRLPGAPPQQNTSMQRFKRFLKTQKKIQRITATYDFETRMELDKSVFVCGSEIQEQDLNMSALELGERQILTDRVVAQSVPTLVALHFVLPSGEQVTKHWLGVNCAQEFIEYLAELHARNIHLSLYAHNGAGFDALIMLGEIKKHAKFRVGTRIEDAILKGSRILKLPFLSHIFLDTANFLPGKLDNLCKAFKVEQAKQTKVLINGENWDTMDVCLMLPKLSPAQFVGFLNSEPGQPYKKAYIEYCIQDCVSLFEVWTKFSAAFDEITAPLRGPNASPLITAVTLPGAAMKLFKLVNAEDKGTEYWTPNNLKPDELLSDDKIDEDDQAALHAVSAEAREIYAMLDEAICGGISHVAKPGYHFSSQKEPLALIDVVSLYVWAMLRCQFPKGAPEITYDPQRCEAALQANYFGVYTVKNVKLLPNQAISSFPAYVKDRRDWNASFISHAVMTHLDVLRIRAVSGQSLEIVKGLIWRESYNPFVAVLSDITNMKKQQDIYKTERPDLYNCSLRECCKLLGNSLYGKTMERCALSKWHEFATLADYLAMTPIEQDKLVQPVHYCNNSLYVKTPEQRQKEAPLQFGVFVLAHTRDLMQRYFDIIGRENIIATETDSIYCSQKSLQPLLVSQDPLFCIGTDLGQMVIEMDNITEAFFLGKKCYSVRIGKNKYKHRLKGVPGKFLNWSAYRRLFLQWEVTFPYVCDSPDGESSTEPQGDDAMVQFQRNLFSAASSGVKLKKLWKTVVAQQDYKIYDHCNGCLKLVSIDQCPLAEHAQLTAKGNDLQQPPPAKKQKRARPSRSFAEMLIFSDAGKPLPHQATQQRLYDYLRTNKIVS